MVEELKKDIINLKTKDFYHKYLVGQDVWYFKENCGTSTPSDIYDKFKLFVSENLDVHFNNISIVGSAKIGISLAPDKNFKSFDADSDFDLILVSPRLFEEFWNAYLDLFRERKPFRYRIVASNIFRRFISIKKPDPNHPSFKNWIERIEKFNKDYQIFFNINCDINYRIYDSWDSVERYHFKGIEELRNNITGDYGTTN